MSHWSPNRRRAACAGRTLAGVLAGLVALVLPGTLGSAQARAAAPPPTPSLAVTGACLLDAASGQVLYSDRGDAELPIASTTKLMTALVTLEQVHHLSEVLTQNDWYAATGDSQIGLAPGERMSVHDLLIALLLPSADDAAEDLAYNLGGGSIARFVAMMNAAAQALGLTHTHYSTPIGFDTPGNYSSPCDLDRLAAYDMQTSPYFARVVALPSAELWSGRYPRHVVNTNDLVGKVSWIHGVKTGHTAAAGYVLVSEGERSGLTLIGSVLGTASEAARDAAGLALLDYGFAAFHELTPITAGAVLARPGERGLPGRRATVIATSSFSSMVPVSARVQVMIRAPRVLTGPLRRHAIVGEVIVLIAGRAAARIPLELAAAVPTAAPLGQAARFLIRPSTLILLALAVAAGGALVGSRRRRPRATATGRLEEG